MTDIISTIIAQNPNIVEEIKAEEALTPYQKKQLLCYKYYRNRYATDADFKKKQDGPKNAYFPSTLNDCDKISMSKVTQKQTARRFFKLTSYQDYLAICVRLQVVA